MRRPFDHRTIPVTLLCLSVLQMLYQDGTIILMNCRPPPLGQRIVTTHPPPPSRQEDDLPTTFENVERDHAFYDPASTTTTTTPFVPHGHSTIFVPQPQHFDYYYRSKKEMQLRHERFPSVPERVQLYMSTWYSPPCRVEDQIRFYTYYPNRHHNDKTATTTSTTTTTVFVRPIGIILPAVHPSSPDGLGIFVNETATTSSPPLLSIDSIYSRSPLCFLYDRTVIQECTDHLCRDANQYFVPYADQYFRDSDNNDVPLLLQHGDANFFRAKVVVAVRPNNSTPVADPPLYLGNPNIPIFKKFRRAMTPEERALMVTSNNDHNGKCRNLDTTMPIETIGELKATTNVVYHDAFQPIISIVSNFGRHFYSLMHVIENDTEPWDQKKSRAIYRGLCTGRSKSMYRGKNTDAISEYDLCQQIPRCRLVYEYHNSTLVDAKLTASTHTDQSYSIHGIPMIGHSLSMKELLQNKGIIMIEGNDVSSGLKWALFSKSVVLTQTPTVTSWAMEELLVPWVHYIPLANDLSDVHEKVQWMLDHDMEAQEIANNGHLWMTDMIFHPDAMREHEEIIRETFRRYQTHFRYDPRIMS